MVKKGYRGYCMHQPFNGLRVPVAIQNVYLRDFLNNRGLSFKPSVNELDVPGCDVQLMSLVDDLEEIEGIVMTSMFMLPDNKESRQRVYDKIKQSESAIWFALDGKCLIKDDDIAYIERTIKINKLLSNCPRQV